MKEKFAIAVHGGAGTLSRDEMTREKRAAYEWGLKKALNSGLQVLLEGGSSLAAVERAVNQLENDALFNAGRGSAFTNEGSHEMDAAIMDGKTNKAGCVAGVTGVKNPVSLAKLVMENTKYVLLVGSGAMDFARRQNVQLESPSYFYTDERMDQLKHEQGVFSFPKAKKIGTVGAVALDKAGNLAAATSTGGISNKMYGRVGDTPVIGAGTYANNDTCAVSCTGEGEEFIRSVLAFDVSCLMEYKGYSLEQACDYAFAGRLKKMKGSGGLIALDSSGNISMPFNTEGMYRAAFTSEGKLTVKIFDE